ncbi:MAG: NAD(+) kinase, partial [Flavobacteriia bacterium]|nr:NAD(+) kinase [Flavobacteriia bacterium]
MLQIRNSGAGIVLFEALAETVAALDGNAEEISVFSDHVQLNRYAPDFLITLGGDGTILEAATIVRDARIPIL